MPESSAPPPPRHTLRPQSGTQSIAAPPLGPPESTRDALFADDDAQSEARGRTRRMAKLPLASLIDIAQPRLTLTVEREGGEPTERTVVHDGDVCRIGTHPSNDVALEDPAISQFHCRIVRDAHGWLVEDLGSLNGTFASDFRVNSVVLSGDAVIRLGESLLRIRSEVSGPEELVPAMLRFGGLMGTGRAMRKLFAMLEKIAASDINCFVHGESGTGKELVASEVVQRGVRADKPFVVVDCGAISPTLVESELFGHVRGAFTGADRDRIGAFEAADGGTVFLDEIGELPLAVQPKLLRALQQREIRRVGETRMRKVDVRVIAATNRDLEREVNKGTFREDLYFRLAVITLRVPRLRDRLEDVPHLIRAFLTQLGAEDSDHLFGPSVIEELSRHEWPGNVRELRNYVERSVVLQSTRVSSFPPAGPAAGEGGGRAPGAAASVDATVDIGIPYKIAKEVLVDGFERAYFSAVIEACGGNLTKAARMAGIDRMYLHRLVQKHSSRDELPPSSGPATPGPPSSRRG